MIWDTNLVNLKYVLADLYFLQKDSIPVVLRAGLPVIHIAFQDKAVNNWSEILNEAKKRGKVSAVIEAALQDYPDNQFLLSAHKGLLTPAQNVVEENLTWQGDTSLGTLEALLHKQSTLLSVSWFEAGIQRALSVAKVTRADDRYATGFLTHNNIFVTNHHAISTIEEAKGASVQFNYQLSYEGLGTDPTAYEFDPALGFKTSAEDDWTLIRVKGDANQTWGAINVEPVDIKVGQRANIIQHPGGAVKQIAIHNNMIAHVEDKRIQYYTDTLPGSSGSPVFDNEWQLIGLHQRGGWVVQGDTKRRVYPNKGIHIHCLLEAISSL